MDGHVAVIHSVVVFFFFVFWKTKCAGETRVGFFCFFFDGAPISDELSWPPPPGASNESIMRCRPLGKRRR